MSETCLVWKPHTFSAHSREFLPHSAERQRERRVIPFRTQPPASLGPLLRELFPASCSPPVFPEPSSWDAHLVVAFKGSSKNKDGGGGKIQARFPVLMDGVWREEDLEEVGSCSLL